MKTPRITTSRRLGTMIAGLLATAGIALAGASSASAAVSLPLDRSASSGPPAQGMCPVKATARVDRTDGGWGAQGRISSTLDIGPNEYLFVGCRWKMRIDLYGVNPWTGEEGVMYTVTHSGTAGAKFDPWGNRKWYDFEDSFPAGYLNSLTNARVTVDPIV
jgi:hypothetical protein